MPRIKFLIGLTLLLALAPAVGAQQKRLSLDDVFDTAKRPDFDGSPPARLRWLKDGIHYLETRPDPASATPQLFKVSALTGEAVPFFDARKMEIAFAKLSGFSAEQAKEVAHRSGYAMNRAETAFLINYANDLFYYELPSGNAVRLTDTPDEEVGEEFSPDGKLVSFVRGGNLFVVDVDHRRERPLTLDGGAKLLNGRLDWVYQEELYGRGNYKGYWWSPDSSRIAYLRLDESPVHEFTLVDHIPRLQRVELESYPKAGDPNPKVSLGILNASGGNTQWVDTFKYEAVDPLIVRVGWTPDSKKVVYQIQNREQTWLDLNYADPASGKTETLFRETSRAWVAINGDPTWLKDGSFLWLSERSGFCHLYHYSASGALIRQITDGRWEITTLDGVDEKNGWAYFTSPRRSLIAEDVYRVRLDGSELTLLTHSEGNHSESFDPTFSYFIDTHSEINKPPEVAVFDGSGKQVRMIHAAKLDALNQFRLGKPEFLKVKTRDGFEMDALMIKPPDFDPSKKYPVLEFTYSGPHAPMVRNRWGAAAYLWHQVVADKGYIVWVCDNRTASGKGLESTWPVYKNFGELELRDLEDGLSWLKSQPYVDGSRIGIWGWSFGGFMTCYALTHSKSFKVGIAGGSVTDWRLYDSIYTERYMGMPQNNPEGYKKSAPLNSARDLSGKLLLIHGMIDDNVHMQNTIQFAYELQKAGKPFQLMFYPKSRHGVTDPLLVKHMYSMILQFVLDSL